MIRDLRRDVLGRSISSSPISSPQQQVSSPSRLVSRQTIRPEESYQDVARQQGFNIAGKDRNIPAEIASAVGVGMTRPADFIARQTNRVLPETMQLPTDMYERTIQALGYDRPIEGNRLQRFAGEGSKQALETLGAMGGYAGALGAAGLGLPGAVGGAALKAAPFVADIGLAQAGGDIAQKGAEHLLGLGDTGQTFARLAAEIGPQNALNLVRGGAQAVQNLPQTAANVAQTVRNIPAQVSELPKRATQWLSENIKDSEKLLTESQLLESKLPKQLSNFMKNLYKVGQKKIQNVIYPEAKSFLNDLKAYKQDFLKANVASPNFKQAEIASMVSAMNNIISRVENTPLSSVQKNNLVKTLSDALGSNSKKEFNNALIGLPEKTKNALRQRYDSFLKVKDTVKKKKGDISTWPKGLTQALKKEQNAISSIVKNMEPEAKADFTLKEFYDLKKAVGRGFEPEGASRAQKEYNSFQNFINTQWSKAKQANPNLVQELDVADEIYKRASQNLPLEKTREYASRSPQLALNEQQEGALGLMGPAALGFLVAGPKGAAGGALLGKGMRVAKRLNKLTAPWVERAQDLKRLKSLQEVFPKGSPMYDVLEKAYTDTLNAKLSKGSLGTLSEKIGANVGDKVKGIRESVSSFNKNRWSKRAIEELIS